MKIADLLETKTKLDKKLITPEELKKKIEKSNKPFFIMTAGVIGAGKSYFTNQYFQGISNIDTDELTKELGDGVYILDNARKAYPIIKTQIADHLDNGKSFILQGTAANLTTALKKLQKAKDNGFETVLFYVHTPIEKAEKQLLKRIEDGGHGETIPAEKIPRTYNGSKFTYEFFMDMLNLETLSDGQQHFIKKAINKVNSDINKSKDLVDYIVKINN